MEFSHVSVLLDESVEGLAIKPDGIYVDGTVGGAGHSRKLRKSLRPEDFLLLWIGIRTQSELLLKGLTAIMPRL